MPLAVVLALVVLSGLDVVTTVLALSRGAVELSPAGGLLVGAGAGAMVVVKGVAVGGVWLAGRWRPGPAAVVGWGLAALTAAAVASNAVWLYW